MIAFACSVVQEARWRDWALPGIRRTAEPDALILDERGAGSLQQRCNRALDAAAAREDLEALVLLHEDTEIVDERFNEKVRRRLTDPEIAIIGPIGGRNVHSIAWWQGEAFGRVQAPLIESRDVAIEAKVGYQEVDSVDGLLMVLSPWAVRNLRFDEDLDSIFHGYDSDICFQARAHGRRVVVDDLEVKHWAKGGIGDREGWARANVAFRRKWYSRSRLWPEPEPRPAKR